MKKLDLDAERLLCETNFVHFFDGYLKYYKLMPYQKRLINYYLTHKRVVYETYEGGQFSPITLAYAIWRTIFHQENIAWFCPNPKTIKPFYQKIKRDCQWIGGRDITFLDNIQGKAFKFTTVIIESCSKINNVENIWWSANSNKFIVFSEPSQDDWFSRVLTNAGNNLFEEFKYGKKYLLSKLT